jgi:hypothetical protein
VNAFALQEKAAWLGEQEKKPPIMLALTHTKLRNLRNLWT